MVCFVCIVRYFNLIIKEGSLANLKGNDVRNDQMVQIIHNSLEKVGLQGSTKGLWESY